MKITFLGAAGEVTGSCHLLETAKARVLVDFGMHQGGAVEDEHNRVMPPFDAPRLDAVIVTHAHIDHIGRLPLLPGLGFKGPIFATPATRDLCPIMLHDSADLQVADAERIARRRFRSGEDEKPVEPLYTENEVDRVLPMITPVPYDAPRAIAPGITARWVDAGHMLGSASVELTIEDAGTKKVVVFSGDIGVKGAALLRDPTPLRHADMVVMESTYGDRDHKPLQPTLDEFAQIIHDAVWAHEKVLIPAFAVGRTQQILYHLGELTRTGKLPRFPIYVDSPMAVSATELYRKYIKDMDPRTLELAHNGTHPFILDDLRCLRSAAESKQLNDAEGAAVIIAASGMCTGGRILHHLKHHVWKRGVHVVIAGYQAQGTLGRQLVDGATFVSIHGERLMVRAKIHTLGGFSAHAGQTELLGWAGNFMGAGAGKPRFALVHGEPKARDVLAEIMRSRFGVGAEKPMYRESVVV